MKESRRRRCPASNQIILPARWLMADGVGLEYAGNGLLKRPSKLAPFAACTLSGGTIVSWPTPTQCSAFSQTTEA
jgi:hypothetical protein